MPPFSGTLPSSAGLNPKRPEPSIVTLNVGGQLFQTTPQTLSLAGPKSLLSSLPCYSSSSSPSEIPFIDRDPELFSLLLSLLRTGRLPSSSSAFDLDDLLAEARFYGLDPDLLCPLSDPFLFDPFALHRSLALPLPGRDRPSAISAAPSGSLLVAHGSKITAFDPALRRRATVLTRFPAVDSLLALSPSLAATGFPGLQLLDLSLAGCVAHALHWFPLPATATTSSSVAAGANGQEGRERVPNREPWEACVLQQGRGGGDVDGGADGAVDEEQRGWIKLGEDNEEEYDGEGQGCRREEDNAAWVWEE